jgi:hypothetical protein
MWKERQGMSQDEFIDYLEENMFIDTSDDELSEERHYKADKEAQKRGYENWHEAYFDLCE